MTEKRFRIEILDDENWLIEDNETGLDYNPIDGTTRVLKGLVDLVNNLYEENEQLKQTNQKLYDDLQETIGYLGLKSGIEKENEQLKNENYELHKRLGDFEPFERYMKERTSKTSVNDIIGLVKTDEPTNSVELKKELYK